MYTGHLFRRKLLSLLLGETTVVAVVGLGLCALWLAKESSCPADSARVGTVVVLAGC
jgi:hypothetical protein